MVSRQAQLYGRVAVDAICSLDIMRFGGCRSLSSALSALKRAGRIGRPRSAGLLPGTLGGHSDEDRVLLAEAGIREGLPQIPVR
jgi:hypothetical protein